MVLDMNAAVQLHGPQHVCIEASCHLNRNVLHVWWSKQPVFMQAAKLHIRQDG